jgi:(p)ppGpp synthase/HD superfamily hydrolase
VAAIVKDCTGYKKEHISDFRERKQRSLDHLRADAGDAAIRVSLADKAHNARSIVNDLEADGPAMWARF